MENNNNLILPAVGSVGPWGQTLNNNFRFVDQELRKMHEKVEATSNLIGANVPYVNVDDNYRFVDIIKNANKITFQYKTYEKENNPNNDFTYDISTYTWEDQNPPLFIASYVDNIREGNNTLPSITLDTETFVQGDIIVIVQQLGSIYGSNNTPITFKKYLPVPEIYVPFLTADEPYKLKFERKNYSAAYDELENKQFILPSIGLGVFNYLEYNDGECSINGGASNSINTPDNILTWDLPIQIEPNTTANDYLVHVNFFISSISDAAGAPAPAFVSYTIEKTLGDSTLNIKIKVDISGLADNELLRCEQIISHRAWATRE